MSYGTGKKRKDKLKKLKEITNANLKEFLRLAGDQYVNDYVNIVNNRASDNETPIDAQFLNAVAKKDLRNAFDAFEKDTSVNLSYIVKDILRKQTDINYEKDVDDNVKRFFETSDGHKEFLEVAKISVRKILQAPLQMGLSRTVLQKYL